MERPAFVKTHRKSASINYIDGWFATYIHEINGDSKLFGEFVPVVFDELQPEMETILTKELKILGQFKFRLTMTVEYHKPDWSETGDPILIIYHLTFSTDIHIILNNDNIKEKLSESKEYLNEEIDQSDVGPTGQRFVTVRAVRIKLLK